MSGLSAPGSSVYNADSMYVGDGTWDSQRNTFLLPNLQGLNFETMRYNGKALLPRLWSNFLIMQVWAIDFATCPITRRMSPPMVS
jgi:hypothetical protein